MKPRHKKLAAIGGGVVALGIVVALVLTAFQKNLVFFFSPTQVAAKEAAQGLPVVYRGALPDLFREGKMIVAQGQLGADGVFQAREVLAKHDENYMPPEAKEAVEKAHLAAKKGKS